MRGGRYDTIRVNEGSHSGNNVAMLVNSRRSVTSGTYGYNSEFNIKMNYQYFQYSSTESFMCKHTYLIHWILQHHFHLHLQDRGGSLSREDDPC
jgi:hypothetical protein